MVLKRILIVDDEPSILTSLRGVLEDEGFVVETANRGSVALTKLKEFTPDVVLLDIWMPEEDGIVVLTKIKKLVPDTSIIMMSGHGTIETAVKAIKLGAFDFMEKPLHSDKLLLLLRHAFELKDLQTENRYLKEELHTEESLIGRSPTMTRLQHLISVTAPSSGWVLIHGENGTGKELVARSLHKGSLRSEGRFVAVNCAAIPDELIESELFGHEKGAFTNAFEKKIGRFEQAHGGTLFLDEVGDMSQKMQAKILRALQECSITRVGGGDAIEVDVRVIAATNKDLRKAILEGDFREDLFYRLNVIPILVPPLRERREDIPLLARHFLQRFDPKGRKKMNQSTLQLLQSYAWPGNVRELKNWVERACILSSTDSIQPAELTELFKESPSAEAVEFEDKTFKAARASFEKQFILKMLEENGGNISRTAQAIGLERSHLHKKMKSYGIDTSGGPHA